MRKLLFLFPAILVCLLSCDSTTADVKGFTVTSDSATTSTALASKAEQNKQTILASMQGMNMHDVNMVFANTAPGAKDYGDGSMPAYPMDSIKAMMGGWFTAFPDYKVENMKVTADNEWVMVWSDQSGTWKGDLWGQKPTGKSFKTKDVDIFRMNKEGKITEHHNVQSFAVVAKQIGYKME